jgi:NNMT/PNMT/TEMT family protein
MRAQVAAVAQVANLLTAPKSRNMDAVLSVTAPPTTVRNRDWDWDSFDPRSYFDDNYRTVRDDDRQIVEIIRDFFAAAKLPSGARGVDVGPGANLYPSFAMLPFCESLELLEFSAANVRWLRRRQRLLRARIDHSWDPFWRVYAAHPAYRDQGRRYAPLVDFRRKATVRQADVFTLPSATYDMGTMFFVACSLSTEVTEFRQAVDRFVRSLTPEAPFAAAFMTGSSGYEVGGHWFPAVPIDEDEISRSFAGIVYDDLRIHPIDSRDPLRPNVGMVLATGRALASAT